MLFTFCSEWSSGRAGAILCPERPVADQDRFAWPDTQKLNGYASGQLNPWPSGAGDRSPLSSASLPSAWPANLARLGEMMMKFEFESKSE